MKINKCPGCGKPLKKTSPDKSGPFCSERCQLIDLGEWLSGNKKISDSIAVDEEISSDDKLIH